MHDPLSYELIDPPCHRMSIGLPSGSGSLPLMRIRKYSWLWIGVTVLLLVGFLYLRLYYTIYSYPQESMSPTIKKGSRLLVDMKAYKSKSPALWDLVVYNQTTPVRFTTVRRVVGLPKDHISYSSWGGRLLNNGQLLEPPPNLSIEWK